MEINQLDSLFSKMVRAQIDKINSCGGAWRERKKTKKFCSLKNDRKHTTLIEYTQVFHYTNQLDFHILADYTMYIY